MLSKNKPKKSIGFLDAIIFIVVIVLLYAGYRLLTKSDYIIDATQFSNISQEELISIMGEPTSIQEWEQTRANGTKYNVTTYEYFDEVEFFFHISNDMVKNLTFNSKKTDDPNEGDIKFDDIYNILDIVNLDIINDFDLIEDTENNLLYVATNDEDIGVWIRGIDYIERTYNNVWIIYNYSQVD